MIATVTPNPCIDYMVQVDELLRNEVARAKGTLLFPGGVGVNVARTVTRLGEVPVTAYGLVGGHLGSLVRSLLDAENVIHDFIDTGLETRIDQLLTLIPDRSLVQVSAPGPEIPEEFGTKLIKQLLGLEPAPAWLVLGGSLPGRQVPPPLPRNFYGLVLDEFRKKPETRVVIDCREGVALGHGVEKGPFLVRLGEAELGRLAGRRVLATEKELIAAAESLVETRKVGYFVILRGSLGCLVVGAGERYRVTHAEAVPLSRVGASDAFTGGLVWALAKGDPVDEAARYALTVGTATVLSPATALFRKEEVERLHGKCSVERI